MVNKYFVESDEVVDKAIEILSKEPILSGDTETNGLDPYTATLWSVQLGSPKELFLFPYSGLNEVSRQKLRDLCASRKIIFHNAKFDVKMLTMNGFRLSDVWCSQEAERVIYAGKYFTFGLKDLVKRYFQIDISKEIRNDFWDGVFQKRVDLYGHFGAWSDDYIEYALEDICYLHDIYNQQIEASKELGLQEVLEYEAKLVIEVAYMELRGVWLDNKALKKFKNKVNIRRDELQKEVYGQLEKSFAIGWQREYARRIKLWDEWQAKHKKIVAKSNSMRNESDKRRKTDEAKNMVQVSLSKKPYIARPSEINDFNPKSPAKLALALSEVTGLPITTTAREWLDDNIQLHPVIADLVEFRKFEKLSQFCEIVENVNPVTKRIHASFNQNGTKAGRFSCSDPNLQQIPARTEEAKEFRALFTAARGHKFVGADYAGIELVILAQYSKEKALIDAINSGKDIHCYSMSLFLGCEYDILKKLKDGEELSGKELKNFNSVRDKFENLFNMPSLKDIDSPSLWVKTFRDYVKTLTYGLAYGLTSHGLSKKFHCEYSVAESFINKFFSVYPRLKKFLNSLEELGFQRRYAVNPVGRRRWFTLPKKKTIEEIEKEVIKNLDKEKRVWESVSDKEWDSLMRDAIAQAEKEYKGKLNSIKRQAGNFFPQSLCAEMVKQAMVEFGKQWGEHQTGIILTVHDELVGEFREEDVERAKALLEQVMTSTAKKYLPDINVKVDAHIMKVWEKN